MTEVIMPKMGDGMEEGTLLEWLKKDGDKVKSGEVIGSIQTDKATLDLEAPSSGTLTGFLVQPGQTVPVGVPIAAILGAGDSLPGGWGGSGSSAAPSAAAPTEVPVAAPVESKPAAAPATAPVAETKGGRVKASPLAKKIASEKGIDLSAVTGSGPNGRIIERDLPSAAPSKAVAASAPTGEDRTVSLNKIRQITAQRTLSSKQNVPHFYVTLGVDVDKLIALKDQFEQEEAGKVTLNDFVVRACSLALRDMPVVNSEYRGGTLLEHGDVNIGLAVALEDGLTVPVIHHADALGIKQIGDAARTLAKKARENKLHPDELSGATFTISNMGMLNVDVFSAIIVQPNAAILAVSTARKQVVVADDGSFVAKTMMNITGSFDHRVVDGAVGARFMNAIAQYLENPTRMLG